MFACDFGFCEVVRAEHTLRNRRFKSIAVGVRHHDKNFRKTEIGKRKLGLLIGFDRNGFDFYIFLSAGGKGSHHRKKQNRSQQNPEAFI